MFDSVLISADNNWFLWSILLGVAAFSLWAEKTKLGAKLSGAMIAIISTFVLSNLSIIPSSAPAYDVVWSYLVPLAIPLLLFKANLRKILKEAGPTLIAFTMGGIGTVIGTVIAFHLIPLGEEGWQLAGIFCSTYIGGSMNFVAAAEAVQLRSGDILSAGIAADNLIMTVYFLILFALPSIKFLQKLFPNKHQENAEINDNEENYFEEEDGGITLANLSMSLFVSTTICAVGYLFADLSGIDGIGILVVTALVIIIATSFPKQIGAIEGGDKIGMFFMSIFFAAIGASANIKIVMEYGSILFLFAALILLIHLIFLLTAGKLLKLDLAEMVVASNANMGGPTTAAAMAAARKWKDLVIPAILCGTLGYAIATFIGVGVGFWLK
ncbi:MAG: DUF819 family protein [Melioribacteraceae bacterium]|nr:DUF819 family protein [Melioribacteraceae bacterium]MCF8264163.1 DUF819 family protein [Melioribacteraceae bacterium]MCF8430523.1 DUF819 family protein [Melioribacteraceae bacterium]